MNHGTNGRGKVLIHDGYKYQLNAKAATTMTWRCWRKSCRFKINLFNRDDDDAQIEVMKHNDNQTNNHNHEADDKIIGEAHFINKAKAAVLVDPTKPIKRIYDEKVAAAHRNARVQGGGDRFILHQDSSLGHCDICNPSQYDSSIPVPATVY